MTDHVSDHVADQVMRLLQAISGEMTRKEIQTAFGLKQWHHLRTAYINSTLRMGLIQMTIPDKPRSGKQRYGLTRAGCEHLRGRG